MIEPDLNDVYLVCAVTDSDLDQIEAGFRDDTNMWVMLKVDNGATDPGDPAWRSRVVRVVGHPRTFS